MRWYVDTMVQVILLAGDYVAEAVWYRVVQVVTNAADIHEYAAEKLLTTAQSKWSDLTLLITRPPFVMSVDDRAHETLVAVAAYLLGEIGVTICEKPGMSGLDQLKALVQHIQGVSVKVP